jgi:hypothetical protein
LGCLCWEVELEWTGALALVVFYLERHQFGQIPVMETGSQLWRRQQITSQLICKTLAAEAAEDTLVAAVVPVAEVAEDLPLRTKAWWNVG